MSEGGGGAAEYTYATILQVRAIYWVVEVSEWECLLWCESSCASVNKPWKWVTHSSIFSGRSLTAWLPLWGSGISLRRLSCMAKAQDLIPSLLKQQILETDGRRTHIRTHARWQGLPRPARMNLTSRLRLSLGCNSVRIVSTDPDNSLCHHLKVTFSLGILETDDSAEKRERDVWGKKKISN